MKLSWDDTGKRLYETGVRQGVLYPYDTDEYPAFSASKAYAKGDKVTHENKYYIAKSVVTAGVWNASSWTEVKSKYSPGVSWNGLTAATETPSGAEETAIYADDIKYLSLRSKETYGNTIEAYTYPDEWMLCDGSAEPEVGVVIGQQKRRMFGLSYRTAIGNDTDGDDHGYKLHLIYGATASPSERSYATINDSPEAITFSWEISTTPVKFDAEGDYKDYDSVSCLTVDSTKVGSAGMAALEEILYGTVSSDPYLPLPDEVMSVIQAASGNTGA